MIGMPQSYLKANYRVIEQDLYNYELMKRNIEKVIEEYKATEDFEPAPSVSTNRPVDGGGRPVGKVSDPTLRETLKCMLLKERFNKIYLMYSAIGFTEMVRRVEAIEYVLKRLESSSIGSDRLKAKLVKKRYFEKQLTPEGLAQVMHISRATVYRWCDDVIREIAAKLGFMV